MQHRIAVLITKLFTRDECGASVVEYALLVSMVALVCVGAVTFLGAALPGNMETAGSALS